MRIGQQGGAIWRVAAGHRRRLAHRRRRRTLAGHTLQECIRDHGRDRWLGWLPLTVGPTFLATRRRASRPVRLIGWSAFGGRSTALGPGNSSSYQKAKVFFFYRQAPTIGVFQPRCASPNIALAFPTRATMVIAPVHPAHAVIAFHVPSPPPRSVSWLYSSSYRLSL